MKKKKLLYLYLEPFIKGHGGYMHAQGMLAALKKYYDIALYYPLYKNKKKLPGGSNRFLLITLAQLRALFSIPSSDVIYIRSHFMSILLFIASFLCKKTILLEVNGPITDIFFHRRVFSGVKYLIEKSIKIQMKMSDALLVVTPQLGEYFSKEYKIPLNKIYMVPNAASKPAKLKNGHFYKRDRIENPKVVYIGSLMKWQGIDDLLKAVQLKEVWPKDLSLHIYGYGPMLRHVLEASSKNPLIQYKGFLEETSKAAVYSGSLFSIIPKNNSFNRHETGLSPIKLYESLSYSTPVLVTDLPYLSDLVKNHNMGVVIPYESPLKLALAVRNLYDNKRLLSTLSKNAYKFIINGNTWDDRALKVYTIAQSHQHNV